MLDTETTGLATRTDRIVQIGAVRITAGQVDTEDVFDRLVNPGISIPEASTAIHGLSDQDVAPADRFADVMPAFADWTGTDLVLGYAIGFDLAMFEAEHRRAGLPWKTPRSLDVAHLVALAAPSLPSTGLDAAATWLGIQIRNRHQALGDARLAALVYLALLPKLKARGITTLAEAERACRGLTARGDREAEAGWHAVAAKDQPGKGGLDQSRIDSVPYRFRVRDVITSPPALVDENVTIEAVLARMKTGQINSIFMPQAESSKGFGILTDALHSPCHR